MASIIHVRTRQHRKPIDLCPSDVEVGTGTARQKKAARWRQQKAWTRLESGTPPKSERINRRTNYLKRFNEERQVAKRHPELEPARQQKIRRRQRRADGYSPLEGDERMTE